MTPRDRKQPRRLHVGAGRRPTLDQVLDREGREPWTSEKIQVAFFGDAGLGTELVLHDVEEARREGAPLGLDVKVDRRNEDGSWDRRWIRWTASGITPQEVASLAVAFQELVARMIERGLYDTTPNQDAAS
jgi:hypothetical protein